MGPTTHQLHGVDYKSTKIVAISAHRATVPLIEGLMSGFSICHLLDLSSHDHCFSHCSELSYCFGVCHGV